MVALAACTEHAWPPGGAGEWVDFGATVTKSQNAEATDALFADTTLYESAYGIQSKHARQLVIEDYYPAVEWSNRTMLPDSVVWEDVEMFYADAFAGTGLARDSTVDAVVESPSATSRVAAWSQDGRWGNDGLSFMVTLTTVRSRLPGKTYKILNVYTPRS